VIERHELARASSDYGYRQSAHGAGKMVGPARVRRKVLKTVHGPRWRLLVIGAGQVSRYLAQMAQALDYHVTVATRAGIRRRLDFKEVPLNRGYPDDVVVQMTSTRTARWSPSLTIPS